MTAGEKPAHRWLQRWITVALWLLSCAVAACVGVRTMWTARKPTYAFSAYYTAASLVREGANVALFYDDMWFRRQVERKVPPTSDIFRPNPPAMALMALPIAGLDPATARSVALVVSLLCLAAAGTVLIKRVPVGDLLAPAFLAYMFAAEPVRANLRYCQAYAILLLLLALAWCGFRFRRDALLGVTLGLLLVLKTAMAPLWLLLVLVRRWRALIWGAATVAGVILISLPWLGAASWATYARLAPGFATRPELAMPTLQTHLGFFRRLFWFHEGVNPAPVTRDPAMADMCVWIAGAIVLVLCSLVALRDTTGDLSFSAFVLAGLVITPGSSANHYALVLVPVALLFGQVLKRPTPMAGVALAAALVLVGLFPQATWAGPGWRALLAYPKLYGAWILLGLSLSWVRPQRVAGMRDPRPPTLLGFAP